MLPAITSVRLDSSAGTCDSHGIHSSLILSTPIQSRAALLMSQSMPLACLVFSSRKASGGFCEKPSVMPSFCALPNDPSPQLSNIGLDSLKKVGSSASAGAAGGKANRATAKPNTAVERPARLGTGSCSPVFVGDADRPDYQDRQRAGRNTVSCPLAFARDRTAASGQRATGGVFCRRKPNSASIRQQWTASKSWTTKPSGRRRLSLRQPAAGLLGWACKAASATISASPCRGDPT